VSPDMNIKTLPPAAVIAAIPNVVSVATLPPPQLNAQGLPIYGQQLVWRQTVTVTEAAEVTLETSFFGGAIVVITGGGEWSVTAGMISMELSRMNAEGARLSPVIGLEGALVLRSDNPSGTVDVSVYAVSQFPAARELLE
jgi:hypothetical protein